MRESDAQQALASMLTAASGAAVIVVAGLSMLTASARPEPLYADGVAGAYGASAAIVATLASTSRLPWALRLFAAQSWLVALGFLPFEGSESGHTGVFFVTILLAGLLLRPGASVVAAVGSALAGPRDLAGRQRRL